MPAERRRLSARDVASVRAALEAERAQARARLAALSADFEGLLEAGRSIVADDEHDPEGATLALERAQVTTLAEQARAQLAELERAEARLQDGSYGLCAGCGQEIPLERLAARPTASTCIECASRKAR